MTGLQEWQLIRVTYRSDSYRELEYPGGYPDGGYTPKYEITAVEVEDHSSGEWVETMIITQSRLSGVAFESDCFYAYDFNLNLCRVYCSDMTGLYEGQRIRVTYNEESRVNIEEPQPPGGWSPKYEVTAQSVYADGQTGLQENLVYFDLFDQVAWNGEIYKQTSTRYVVSVTEEEKQMLQAMPASQKWSNPAYFSSPDFYHGSMTMIVDGKIARQKLYRNGLLQEQGFADLNSKEEALLSELKSRAVLVTYSDGHTSGYYTSQEYFGHPNSPYIQLQGDIAYIGTSMASSHLLTGTVTREDGCIIITTHEEKPQTFVFDTLRHMLIYDESRSEQSYLSLKDDTVFVIDIG